VARLARSFTSTVSFMWRVLGIALVVSLAPGGAHADGRSLPGKPTDPFPANGAINVPIDGTLAWSAGPLTSGFRVQFGTTAPGSYRGYHYLSETSYDPGALQPGVRYYWRIDATNVNGETAGDVWHFTTVGAPAPADFDDDDDVDLADYGDFITCYNGPHRPPPVTACQVADFDNDDDVDLSDYAVFLTCYNGPDAWPNCVGDVPLHDPIPARPPGAMTGSAFIEEVDDYSLAARETCILNEVTTGNLPAFLRNFVAVPIAATIDGTPHTATYFVTPDYLCIGSNADFVRMPMTPGTAQQIADAFECLLPTRRMVDQIYAAAELKLAPQPISPSTTDITAVATFYQHHQMIESQRGDAPLGLLIGGIKKDVVVTPQLLSHPGRVAIYGWHQLNGRPIQPLYLGHVDWYVDYSHGIRLVSAYMVLDGAAAAVADILRHPDLNVLLSDEGRVADPRY
jgi:hypothetical protein